MSEDQRAKEVLIEKEGRAWRWGEAKYLHTWNGLKQTISESTIKAIALPLAVAIACIAHFLPNQNELRESIGKAIDSPNVTHDLPIIDVPILEARPSSRGGGNKQLARIENIRVVRLGGVGLIPVGTEARAVLVSGASNGIVKAKLLSSLLVDGEPTIPEGATIFGTGKSSEERLFVEFSKAILPTGETVGIRAQALDGGDKILGLKGALIGTRTKKMGMAVGFGVLGGMADGLQDTSGTNIFGMQQKKSLKDAALSGASKAALDQSQVYIEEMKNAPAIIEVKKGTEFFLMIDEPKGKEKNE